MKPRRVFTAGPGRTTGVIPFVLIMVLMTGAVHAFDAFGGTGPGTHIGSASDAVRQVFGIEVTIPEVVRVLPVYGLPTYRWPAFTPAELLCEATRDIDIFFFGPLYAHAQTPDFGYKKELSTRELENIELAALWDYLRYMAGWIERARLLLRDGQTREATYLLGVLIHSYQDLWAHRGITNGMHRAYLKHRDIDVDRAADRVAELRKRLPAWLGTMPTLLGDQGATFVAYMNSRIPVAELSLVERKRLLGRNRDIWWEGIVYTVFTTDAEKALRYAERIQWDVEVIDSILSDRESLDEVLTLRDISQLRALLTRYSYSF